MFHFVASLLILAGILIIVHQPLVVAQTTDGTLRGAVINATTEQPAGSVEVQLSKFNADGFVEGFTTTAADDGSFVFDGLDTTDGLVYAASVNHRNVVYSSGMIQFDDGPEQATELLIYETTVDQGVVQLQSRGLILTSVTPDEGVVTMLDVFVLQNNSALTLGPDDEARTVRFPVPRNALDVTPFPGFNFGTPSVEGAIVYATSPLQPGEVTATLGYTVPYTGSRLNIEVGNAYPTAEVRLLVPVNLADGVDDITVSGLDLTEAGVVEVGSEEYRLYFGPANAQPGSRLRFAYDSLPPSALQPNSLNVWAPAAIAIAVALAAGALALYLVLRRKLYVQRPVELQPALATSLESRREELVDELRELENANETGNLDGEQYQSMRREILERLRLISRQQRGVGLDE